MFFFFVLFFFFFFLFLFFFLLGALHRSKFANFYHVFILVWGGVCTKSYQSRQETPRTAIQFHYKYTDDVLSLKNTKFAEYLEFIYPREFEIKETTETAAFSSYLDCYLYIDNGKLTTRLYDKRDDFNFPILTFHSWAVISLLHQHTAFAYHS